MKASDFAACEDETTNGVWIARSAFQTVPKVDCAQFILVGSPDAVVAHGDEDDLIG
jgi:hypothetical protein